MFLYLMQTPDVMESAAQINGDCPKHMRCAEQEAFYIHHRVSACQGRWDECLREVIAGILHAGGRHVVDSQCFCAVHDGTRRYQSFTWH